MTQQSLDRRRGQLIVVGTGIHPGQLTLETLSVIKGADRLLYMYNPWVAKLNPVAESLDRFRGEGKHRAVAYEQMVDRILECLRHGEKVCAAFYGHPGVAVWASRAAIRRARAEGFEARMLPGVSSADCLFADLEVDPSPIGCYMNDANHYMVDPSRADTRCHMILWQPNLVNTDTDKADPGGLQALAAVLLKFYSPCHEVTLYVAAQDPASRPIIQHCLLLKLAEMKITTSYTLYIPPSEYEWKAQ
jgi:uncharacterized protein YabN with tetrapyrrole methylase and pyrophosphatase domain